MTHQRPTFLPEVFSEESADLIVQLLSPDQTKRLGCGSRGWLEVMRHPFFDGVDWDLLEQGVIPAPCKPTYRIPLDSLAPPPKTSKPKKSQMEDPSQFTERLNRLERRMFTHFWFVDQNAVQMEIMENVAANRKNYLEETVSASPRGSFAKHRAQSSDRDTLSKLITPDTVIPSTESTAIPIHFNSFEMQDSGPISNTSGMMRLVSFALALCPHALFLVYPNILWLPAPKSFHFRNSSHLQPLLPPLAALYCSIHRNIIPLTAREWLAATAGGKKSAITLMAELGATRLGRQALEPLRGTKLVRAAYTGPNDLRLDVCFLLLDSIMQDNPGSFFEAYDPAEVAGDVPFRQFYRASETVLGRGGYWGVVIPSGSSVSTINASLITNAVFTPSPTRALVHRLYSSRPADPNWQGGMSLLPDNLAEGVTERQSLEEEKGGEGGGGSSPTDQGASPRTSRNGPLKVDSKRLTGYGTMGQVPGRESGQGGEGGQANVDIGAGIVPGAEGGPARTTSRNSWKLQGGSNNGKDRRHRSKKGHHACCTLM